MPYLPSQGPDVLQPGDPLAYLRERLRTCAVEEELFDDEHLLMHFSEGHARALERARALQAVATVTLDGSVEYPLPTDCLRVVSVYLHGWPVELLPGRNSFREGVWGYYIVGDTIGFRPTPAGGETAWLLYLRSPAELEGYDSPLEPAFGPEFYYALVHYARWKAWKVVGGAQRIRQAGWERDQFDLAVRFLKLRAIRTDAARASRFVHVTDGRRPRPMAILNRDVDAG